jgi:hypothetical protein
LSDWITERNELEIKTMANAANELSGNQQGIANQLIGLIDQNNGTCVNNRAACISEVGLPM